MLNLDYASRNLDLCQLCGLKFNVGERIPRILVNCGHTFCTKCLSKKFTNYRIRCIICSKLMKNLEAVERLPLNINILHEIVEKDEILAKIHFEEEEDDETKFCDIHGDRIKHFFCSNHRTIFCRECIRVDHNDDECFVVDLYEIQKMKQIQIGNITNNSIQTKQSIDKSIKSDLHALSSTPPPPIPKKNLEERKD